MPNSSESPQPVQQEPTHESDAVFEVSNSENQETAQQRDAPAKSGPETNSLAGHHPDPEYNSPEEEYEEDEEGEEMDEGQEQETLATSSGMSLHIDPPIMDPHVSVPDASLTSPSAARRVATKRKKGKGKGKGKPHVKKQQAINEKLQALMENLNPIPFRPIKLLAFANHEKLLKKLGLWDFVHLDFDRSIRVDLIAQLVATYDPKSRASYVNGYRFRVNRADLSRALKLPLKKERGNVGGVELDLDWEVLSEDSIGLVNEVLSDWMLLHDDMWMMPTEVMDWVKLIKDGHPEKVDWAALLWFMVEKELKRGGQLSDCYYASHLQHLIKSQREEVFLAEEPAPEKEEVAEGAKQEEEVNKEDVQFVGEIESPREEAPTQEGPSTELTLGQDGEKEEGKKDVEMMDVEKCKDSDEEGMREEEEGQWLLHEKNDEGEHFMQPCGAESAKEFGSFDDGKDEEEAMDGEEAGEEAEEEEEEDEEEGGDGFHVFPNDDALEGDGFAGNLLQAVEENRMGFGSQDQLRNPSSMPFGSQDLHIASAPSFFNNTGKRPIEHDNHASHHSIDGNSKRLRINDFWDNKPMDFGMCMEQIQQMAERARMLYAEKEQGMVQSNMNQEIMLNELQKRDAVIEHLHKTRLEEEQRKDKEIYRLERELYLMGTVLDGYRKTLKDVQRAFAEYKEKAKLAEEPTYKDTGEGGLMLTASELEKLRRKQEEEYKKSCLLVEQKMKEVEEGFNDQFCGYIDKVNLLDKRLISLEADTKELIQLYAKRKTTPTEEEMAEEKVAEEKVAEVSEPLPSAKPKENVPQLPESSQIVEAETKPPGDAEPLPFPVTEEKEPEVAEAPDVDMVQVATADEGAGVAVAADEGPEVAEPLANE